MQTNKNSFAKFCKIENSIIFICKIFFALFKSEIMKNLQLYLKAGLFAASLVVCKDLVLVYS